MANSRHSPYLGTGCIASAARIDKTWTTPTFAGAAARSAAAHVLGECPHRSPAHYNMNKKQKRQPPHNPTPATHRWRWLALGAILVLVLVALAMLPRTKRSFEDDKRPVETAAADVRESTETAKTKKPPIDPQKLAGRWLRPDGGYILEIRKVADDGTLDAGYFNPRPIKVSRAEWQQAAGKLQLFVELRDVGYPGSTYSLECSEAGDKLAGIYFQAAQGTDFPVEFVREE